MPGFTFPSAGPLGLGSPPSRPFTSGHRYYDPLRLPLLRLGSLRFSLDPRYLAFPQFRSFPFRFAFRSWEKPFSAWPFLYSGLPVPVHSARRWRSSRVSRLPLCVHAPLVDSGGVLSTRLCVSRTDAFRQNKNVGFPPARAGVSSRTTTIQFSELSHAACTLATPGFTHTLTGYACRFTSDSAAHLL